MAEHDEELASFLKARRASLRPADVGLPDTGRRRTPGLRREEVAALAGVSIDYLVRIEQGRDVNPSFEVLDALAVALRMNREEREHMLGLASCRKVASTPCATAGPEPTWEVPAGVRAILDRLDPTPAFVSGPWLDVLAWNPSWERLVTPLGMLDGVGVDDGPPNLARFTFTHPRARSVYPAWEEIATEQASRLRSATVPWARVPAMESLVEELHDDPEFASRWDAQTVAQKRRETKRMRHPAGDLAIGVEILHLPDDGGLRLVTWLPADEATAAVFDSAVEPIRRDLRIVADG